MNTDGKMSYKDFIFPVNPYLIKISRKKNTAVHKIPFYADKVMDLGEQNRVITGEGEFFGSDCLEQFERLKEVFASKNGGILYIPSQKPLLAVFDSLELIAQDIQNVIKYSFRFIEIKDNDNNIPEYIISDGNKSLWDYSYLFGIDIETLVRINTDILRPDIPITHGRRVNLC
ncbi:MAG: DNA circularization N-terminal domain-containing protein [Clostridia bacterium]|nr:DNA circularization N-terminal domain-containing protein [Clostridia bacterium]